MYHPVSETPWSIEKVFLGVTVSGSGWYVVPFYTRFGMSMESGSAKDKSRLRKTLNMTIYIYIKKKDFKKRKSLLYSVSLSKGISVFGLNFDRLFLTFWLLKWSTERVLLDCNIPFNIIQHTNEEDKINKRKREDKGSIERSKTLLVIFIYYKNSTFVQTSFGDSIKIKTYETRPSILKVKGVTLSISFSLVSQSMYY